MKLSELVYQCVKNAIYYDDASFTYEQFLMGRYDGDPDYATNIQNVFGPINEAIMRLGDLERIPYLVEDVTATDGFFPKSTLLKPCRSIVGVAVVRNGDICPLPFRELGNKVFVQGVCDGALLCEYKEDIPPFGTYSYTYEYVPNELGGYTLFGEPSDVELKEHNISDAMCFAIIEYAKGNLNEQVAAELANMHVTRAEQYFANIEPAKSALRQGLVKAKYRMGE